MLKSDKKLKELNSILKTGDSDTISEAILLLREEKPFEGAIKALSTLFDRTNDRTIKKLISDFLNDIKDSTSREEIMSEIKSPLKSETISMLVASCWQSGLDYSEYLNDFTTLFIKCDYVTAIECLTVIEESVINIDRNKKDELSKFIKSSFIENNKEKNELILELLSTLER